MLERYTMAESTRDMRRSVYERDLKRPFGKLKLEEITAEELRALCDRVVERQAPATAVHGRESPQLGMRTVIGNANRTIAGTKSAALSLTHIDGLHRSLDREI